MRWRVGFVVAVAIPLGTGAAAVHTRSGSDQLRWRCGLYRRGVLLQSFVVEADVGQPGGWRVHRDYVTSFDLDQAALTGPEPDGPAGAG